MSKRNLLMMTCGTLICALSFCIFLSPYGIMPGGICGIAVILEKLFNYNLSLIIFALNIIFLIIGYLFLGRKEISKAFICSLLFPLFIYLFSLLPPLNFTIDNKLLATVVGSVFYGFGIGFIARYGYTIGDRDILAQIVYKYLKIQVTTATMIIDIAIVILGSALFGFDMLIYSLIAVCIYSNLIDRVILGISPYKSFYIVTSNPEKLKKYIVKELGHSATIIKGRGAYTGEEKYVLFVTIPARDYYKLKDGLQKIDNNAFFVVSSNYEVGGGK